MSRRISNNHKEAKVKKINYYFRGHEEISKSLWWK